MKQIIMLGMILLQSCSTRTSSNDSVKLTKMWINELNQTSVISIYGSDYKHIEGGIAYQRSKSSWPKFVFFFGEDKKVKNQFAILDKEELILLKKNLDCQWREKQVNSVTPHAIQTIPIGECDKYSIKYEFKKDWGLYEVKRKE